MLHSPETIADLDQGRRVTAAILRQPFNDNVDDLFDLMDQETELINSISNKSNVADTQKKLVYVQQQIQDIQSANQLIDGRINSIILK